MPFRKTSLFFLSLLSAFCLVAGPATAGPVSTPFWSDITPGAIAPTGERVISPTRTTAR